MKMPENDWTLIITPRRGLLDLKLRELWQYRDLIMLFVQRDFVAVYKQTILGPCWFLLQPLITTFVFTLVFNRIAGIATDGLPPVLFYLSGVILWNYFANCLTRTSETFIANAGMFGKVYFPRLAVPVSIVLVSMISFVIQFALFLLTAAYFAFKGDPVRPTSFIWVAPLLLLQMGALGMGVGTLVSSLTTRYRDLSFLMGFAVQLWMFASPVVYPLSAAPESFKWAFALNPMASVIENFRHAFLGTGVFDPERTLAGIGITVVLFLFGIASFGRVERTFMDSV